MNKNYDYLTGDLLKARFPYMFNTKDNLGCSFPYKDKDED